MQPQAVRSLLKSDRPSSLTQAITDLGRVPKTIHLLAFLDDETYRRRILIQLNQGEGRHARPKDLPYHPGQRHHLRRIRPRSSPHPAMISLSVNLRTNLRDTPMTARRELLVSGCRSSIG